MKFSMHTEGVLAVAIEISRTPTAETCASQAKRLSAKSDVAVLDLENVVLSDRERG
jgi:hypothetical protein